MVPRIWLQAMYLDIILTQQNGDGYVDTDAKMEKIKAGVRKALGRQRQWWLTEAVSFC